MTFCQDYGDPMAMAEGCQKDADPEYTMDFQDVKPGPEGYIYWCKVCGERARMWEKLINKAFATRPGFQEDFKQAITEAEQSQPQTKH